MGTLSTKNQTLGRNKFQANEQTDGSSDVPLTHHAAGRRSGRAWLRQRLCCAAPAGLFGFAHRTALAREWRRVLARSGAGKERKIQSRRRGAWEEACAEAQRVGSCGAVDRRALHVFRRRRRLRFCVPQSCHLALSCRSRSAEKTTLRRTSTFTTTRAFASTQTRPGTHR
jgi:hypothetical protein